jgi:hypothetical protein
MATSKTCSHHILLWKPTKHLKRPKTQVPPINNNNGGWARSDLEQATTFAEHLSAVFQPLPESCNEHSKETKEYLEISNQMCLPLQNVSP